MIAVPFDHFPSQLGIALGKRQAHPRHLCLWASFAPIVWHNSRWGCRSVTLQQNRVWLFNPIFLSFLSTSPCGLNIYGLVKANMDQHIKCQGLVRKVINLHHYSSSSGEMAGLIQTIHHSWEREVGSLLERNKMERNTFYVSSAIYCFQSHSLSIWYSP